MIVGISGGGYGATLIALHNPGTYSAVESWSGYFRATNPAGTAALDLGSADANDWANANKLLPSVRTLLGVSRPRTLAPAERRPLPRGLPPLPWRPRLDALERACGGVAPQRPGGTVKDRISLLG
jgi:Putative esterase